MIKIYNRIRELREDHDYTQKQIAEILGMKQQQYSMYENGALKLTIEVLRKLCMIYRVSSDYILELPKGLGWPR